MVIHATFDWKKEDKSGIIYMPMVSCRDRATLGGFISYGKRSSSIKKFY